MYICLECCDVYNEPSQETGDWLEHFGTPCQETYTASPCCLGYYEDAVKCRHCGNYTGEESGQCRCCGEYIEDVENECYNDCTDDMTCGYYREYTESLECNYCGEHMSGDEY